MAAAAPALSALARLGLLAAGETPRAEPLAGGVSSEIWKVDLPSGSVCVKRALPRLKVAALWEAPVERNRYEYEWLRIAGRIAPFAVPRLLGREGDLFVMEYLEPAAHPVWKEKLRAGFADPAFAANVGSVLGSIHAATARSEAARRLFATDEIFYAIRLEPYLVEVRKRHADLGEQIESLIETTRTTRLCLVHGDVSPKNILVGPHGPVFLDAECAWYGDPAFDLAFCLNHLLLKCLWVPESKSHFLSCFNALFSAYFRSVSWEKAEDLEARTAALLPGLLLARVDGKSPVEYITEESQKEIVRSAACGLLRNPVKRLDEISERWRKSLT